VRRRQSIALPAEHCMEEVEDRRSISLVLGIWKPMHVGAERKDFFFLVVKLDDEQSASKVKL
jgi:hypothetical protein